MNEEEMERIAGLETRYAATIRLVAQEQAEAANALAMGAVVALAVVASAVANVRAQIAREVVKNMQFNEEARRAVATMMVQAQRAAAAAHAGTMQAAEAVQLFAPAGAIDHDYTESGLVQ